MEVYKHFSAETRAELDKYWDKVEILYNMAVKLHTVNLANYVPEDAKLIHKRNYLFTSKLKEMLFSHYSSKKNVAFAFHYNRDGSILLIDFDSDVVVPEILGNDLFDGFCIGFSDVQFRIKNFEGNHGTGEGFRISLTPEDGGFILHDIWYADIDLFNYI